MESLDRATYAKIYGPTAGDRIRLGDTDLWLEVEAEHTSYGDELLAGYGKTIRDGMLSSSRAGRASALDLLITNVVVFDPLLGVIKTNIGIKDGTVVGVGRAGNPDVVDNVELVLGAHTGIVPGEGMIATPGYIDSHTHLPTPAVIPTAISAGITSLIGMGYGGVFDQGVTPRYNLERLLEAFEGWPINVGLLARAVESASALEQAAEHGACGFKVHEDPGGFPAIIDTALTVADALDVQVAMHTDSSNEAAEFQDTIDAIAGRTIHAYHVEGAGGGHPDMLEVVAYPNVLGSSTTPTLPFTVSTEKEHVRMIMNVHRGNAVIAEDVVAAEYRVRLATIAAEQVLQDMGAIPIVGSDSQGMGRIGELATRTWQTAHVGKHLSIANGEPAQSNDNARLLRYLAKLTINPARAHGLADVVGSLSPGKLADIVLWRPTFFGVKPDLVIKGGFVAWGLVGDGNAAVRNAEPLVYRPMFGGRGAAPASLSVGFVAKQAIEQRPAIRRRLQAISGCRNLTKADLVRNDASPNVRVDPDGPVVVDGREVDPPPAVELPLTQRYFM
jgi:urease subunit alpha